VISIDPFSEISFASNLENFALRIFQYQIKNCKVYGDYVRLLRRPEPKTIAEIPFLPIQFFKTNTIYCGEKTEKDVLFLSSGTETPERSKHFVRDIELYKTSFRTSYRQFFGEISEHVILALLPNYLEQGNSSLVYMVETLIRDSKNDLSGFLLNEPLQVAARYKKARAEGKKVVIIGVSYALMDLADKQIDLQGAIVIETGGMKGRRQELSKNELHLALMHGLNVPVIYSEYGMTELLSQAYSFEKGVFSCPPWMKVLFREINDPLTLIGGNGKGAINVIDLANVHSCSFIATQDLGRNVDGGFVLEGRMEQSDLRGCNLMLDI
jgi:hypothetical protein